MRYITPILAAGILAGCATTKNPVLHDGDVPIGSLGFPVGSYLRIEGERVEGSKNGIQTLRVDTVNEAKLAVPVFIWVENTELFPTGWRCVLKGYEILKMIGAPPADSEAAKEAGRNATVPQADWGVKFHFVATSQVRAGAASSR